jgi:hypothetical protein
VVGEKTRFLKDKERLTTDHQPQQRSKEERRRALVGGQCLSMESCAEKKGFHRLLPPVGCLSEIASNKKKKTKQKKDQRPTAVRLMKRRVQSRPGARQENRFPTTNRFLSLRRMALDGSFLRVYHGSSSSIFDSPVAREAEEDER